MKILRFLASVFLAAPILTHPAQAALLGTFTDDFNRPDGGLGSNYTAARGSAYVINNNEVLRTGSGEDLTILNIGTLPTFLDYANGYSFTASLDVLFVDQGSSRLFGLMLNYQDASNYGAIAIRGDSNNVMQWRGRNAGSGDTATIFSGMNYLSDTWYTIGVSSSAAGVYDVTFGVRGETPYKIGTYTDTTPLAGGSIGFYGDLSTAINYRYDNFSVTVVPEPATIMLALGGVGLLFWRSRKVKMV